MTANGRTQATHEFLRPSDALLEAAKLNRKALQAMEAGRPTEAWEFARIAWSLSAYAEAHRWHAS